MHHRRRQWSRKLAVHIIALRLWRTKGWGSGNNRLVSRYVVFMVNSGHTDMYGRRSAHLSRTFFNICCGVIDVLLEYTCQAQAPRGCDGSGSGQMSCGGHIAGRDYDAASRWSTIDDWKRSTRAYAVCLSIPRGIAILMFTVEVHCAHPQPPSPIETSSPRDPQMQT
jgi:hypothetical protein